MFRLASIFCLCVLVVPSANGQYQWTPPVPIDTSAFPSGIGGAMAVDDSGTIYVTFAGTGPVSIFVVRSTDHGNTWTQYGYAGTELSRVPRDIVVDHNGNVWLLWISWFDEFSPAIIHLSKSTNRGQTFTTLFTSLSYADGFFYPKLAVDAENSIYMLWDDSEFKLTKFRHGNIAQRVDAEIPNDTLKIDSHPALVVSRDFVIHCVWEGLFYDPGTGYHEFVFYSRSNDSGATFQGRTRVDTVDIVGSLAYVHHYPALAVDTNGIVFVSYRRELVVNEGDIRLVRSTDNGESFSPPRIMSDSNAYYESRLSVDSQNGINLLWDSRNGSWHMRSTDGGASFSSSVLVGPIGLHDFKSSKDGLLYATGEHSSRIYFTRTNVILSAPGDLGHANTFSLFQNYPNPFNGSTTVRFSVGRTETIDLRVYDIVGREVGSLVSRRLEPGTYSTTWDATNFSSGVYFIRLTAEGEYTQTRKLVLLR